VAGATANDLCRLPLAFNIRFGFRENDFIVIHFFNPAEWDNVVLAACFRVAFRQFNFLVAFKMVDNTDMFAVYINNLCVIQNL
jgi:hypothetical protein